jgi:hypothetical protein
MDPIDSPRSVESIRKLKTVLQELHTRNAQLVMRDEKLNLQLSFMPPKMWDAIGRAARERSQFYEQQRTDPHYLHLSAGEYMFMRNELGELCADRMQRCASVTVTSVNDLFLEIEDVLEYLKGHNGIVDQPINDDEHIVEDAMRMQLDGDANSTPAVMTAPDMRGGIPTANAIDTPTVDATPVMRLCMIQTIQQSSDNATKRTHNTTVPLGHTVHPSKVHKPNLQANLC